MSDETPAEVLGCFLGLGRPSGRIVVTAAMPGVAVPRVKVTPGRALEQSFSPPQPRLFSHRSPQRFYTIAGWWQALALVACFINALGPATSRAGMLESCPFAPL